MYRRQRPCDSFRNRPYGRPILLCPKENEGMSEISPMNPTCPRRTKNLALLVLAMGKS